VQGHCGHFQLGTAELGHFWNFLISWVTVVRFGVPMVLRACSRDSAASSWPRLSAGWAGKADQRPTRWMSRSRGVAPSGSGLVGGLNQP
jgi:hypothetical protein